MQYYVEIQMNNGNPCPKNEGEAWYKDYLNCETLTEAILFLIKQGVTNTDEFQITHNDVLIAGCKSFQGYYHHA